MQEIRLFYYRHNKGELATAIRPLSIAFYDLTLLLSGALTFFCRPAQGAPGKRDMQTMSALISTVRNPWFFQPVCRVFCTARPNC